MMSKSTLVNLVKYNKCFYTLYNKLGSGLLDLMKHFLHTDDKLIVFASYGGKKFNDSPKAIYEAMVNDPRFSDYKLVWAFNHPDCYHLPKGEIIKIDTLKYYKKLIQARVWITNSSMKRGLDINGLHTLEINTWHGSAIKKMGADIATGNTAFKIKSRKKRGGKTSNYLLWLAQGKHDVKVFSQAYHLSNERLRVIGLPRNDDLAKSDKDLQSILKQKMGIPAYKYVILYAPTFREYEKDFGGNCMLTPPITIEKWRKVLGDKFVLLFRAHYEVVNALDIKDNDFVKDVSNYENLNELMLASDMLISDYSSIFFDYSIMGKPMLCFAYDYERYAKERGLYFDIREELDSMYLDNEDNLLKRILFMKDEYQSETTLNFRDKYVEHYGNATPKVLDIIYQNIINS